MSILKNLKLKISRALTPTRDSVVADILCELERRRSERMPYELQWRLNTAFLEGRQRTEIVGGRLSESEPAYDYEERGVYNRIAPLMDTRIANLQSVSFMMDVHPATRDDEDIAKARISADLLRYTYSDGDFEHKKNVILSWAELCGTAFLLSGWDREGGEIIAHDQAGRPLHTGKLRYTLLSPYEVFPENLWRQNIEDQGSVIIEQIMSAKEIESLYGIRCKGKELYTAVSGGQTPQRDSERVITYMEAATEANPCGTLIQIAAGEIVYMGSLPLGILPLSIFRAKEIAGHFFGKSVIEELIPLQRAYNGCKNKIHDYISTMTAGTLLIEEGSVDVDMMEENGMAPGSPVVYKRGYTPPSPILHDTVPAEVYAECEQLTRDMEYVAGVSQLMVVGSSSLGVTSGAAINSLREIDSVRMALCAENIRAGALHTARLWLKLYKAYCPGVMTLSVAGNSESAGVITWCAEDINSYDVYFTAENQLRVSEQQRKQEFFEAYDRGLFNNPDGSLPKEVKAHALSLLGGNTTEADEYTLQKERAKRENSLFAYTGQTPVIGPLDDHGVHIAEHRRFALQSACRRMNSAEAEKLYLHIREHEVRNEENTTA